MALPAILLALVVGFALDKYIDPLRFRKLVLLVLVILGLVLIVL